MPRGRLAPSCRLCSATPTAQSGEPALDNSGIEVMCETGRRTRKARRRWQSRTAFALVERSISRTALAPRSSASASKNDLLAAGYYKKGCDLDLAISCSNYAFKLLKGIGVGKDTQLAIDLFIKSCEGEYGQGCHNLGHTYWDLADEGKVDLSKARPALVRACELGEDDACSHVKDIDAGLSKPTID